MLGKKRVTTFQPRTAGGHPAGRNTAVAAAVQAARVHLHRVACGEWSRWGCVAEVVMELPLAHDVEVVDTPGATPTPASAPTPHAVAATAANSAAGVRSGTQGSFAARAGTETGGTVAGAAGAMGGWLNAHSRAQLVRSLASPALAVLLCVVDGGATAGPSRDLRAALRQSRSLNAMVMTEPYIPER